MPVPNFGPYRKLVTAMVTGLIGWVTAVIASSSDSITSTEWVMLATIIATALGVYGVPNTDTEGS